MSDQFSNYSFALGTGLYGTGLGVLTVYPQATGSYWIYNGSNGVRPSVSTSLSNAIVDSGMELNVVGRNAVPLDVAGASRKH
jgi:hypothetical protein